MNCEVKDLLKSLGIEEEYEGIGHCALGYIEGDYPNPVPRKEYFIWNKRYIESDIPLF